jgi:hypothetical protein
MPDIEPNDDVKQYLEKKGVNSDDLGGNTIAALNSLSPKELNALDKVDLALEQDGHAAAVSPRAVH